jgi:predicted glutamine amidotransferase
MCELMGLSFDRPVSADFSIRSFALRDADNASGWGLAWYPDRSATIIKEPLGWRQSSYTKFLETYPGLRSTVYIAHVRHQTTGGLPTHADTHPFGRELAGLAFCFAHNGTLPDFRELPLNRFQPLGGTDSEHIFCHLLAKIAERDRLLEDESGWRWLHRQLTELNRYGKLNCLMSDGVRLYCYHDLGAWKGLSLRRLSIREGQDRHFEDAGMAVDVQKDETHSVNYGYVIATYPLSKAGWVSFVPGQLIVLQGSSICFSSQGD